MVFVCSLVVIRSGTFDNAKVVTHFVDTKSAHAITCKILLTATAIPANFS